MGQQFFAVLRDEISVHVPSFKLWVARQFEEEVNVGVQPNNLRGKKKPMSPVSGENNVFRKTFLWHLLFLLSIFYYE